MCLRGGALPEATNCSSRLPLSSEPTLSPLTKAHRLFSNSGEYSGCTCGSWNRHQRHKDHFSTIIKWILEQAHIRTIIRSRASEKTRLQYCETRRETCILIVIFRLQIFFQSCYSLAKYLIFVIFFTRAKFLENKIYIEKTRKLRQNTQKIANFLRYYGKIHSKLPIFRVNL